MTRAITAGLLCREGQGQYWCWSTPQSVAVAVVHCVLRRTQAQHGEVTLADTLARAGKATSELTQLRTENQMLMQVGDFGCHVRAVSTPACWLLGNSTCLLCLFRCVISTADAD